MTNQSLDLASPLLRSFYLGDLLLNNRVVMAPMTRSRAGEERLANPLMARYYGQRASAGLIISEATSISKQAIGWLNTPGIYTQEQALAWKVVTDEVHQKGGRIFLQLWHCGRASHSSFQPNGQKPVAPSALRIENDSIHTPFGKMPYEIPRPLETLEIRGIVRDYQQAAHYGKLAGFDGVEIHGANGYLLDQFLQEKTNQRMDAYGGSLENRFRIIREVVEAICEVWPSNRVGIRLSPNGRFNDMGDPYYRTTFLYAAQQLNAYQLAYLHIMDGTEYGVPDFGTPMAIREFRSVFDGPLIGNLGYTQQKAEEALQAGNLDLISFGRPYIANPDLVERFTHQWPLNQAMDLSLWYSFDEKGYTDYPAYQAQTKLLSI